MGKPTLKKIINKVSKTFNVEASQVTDVHIKTQNVREARLMCVYLAKAADYSNKDIANALGYKTPDQISVLDTRAMSRYRAGNDYFTTRADTLANALRL